MVTLFSKDRMNNNYNRSDFFIYISFILFPLISSCPQIVSYLVYGLVYVSQVQESRTYYLVEHKKKKFWFQIQNELI